MRLNRCGLFLLALLGLIVPHSALAADLAPNSLPIGAQIHYDGNVDDSLEGQNIEYTTFTVTSATTFQAVTPTSSSAGTLSYSKTAPDTATISYTFNYSEPAISLALKQAHKL